VFLADKLPRVEASFQADTPDVERQQLLAEGRIAYVLYGPRERSLGGFEPGQAAYLREEAQAGGYEIFRVQP
jgi:hypothetical protein